MKEIIPPKISIKELRVESLSPNKKSIDISLAYVISIENLQNVGRIIRKFLIGDNIINFIIGMMEDLKKVSGTGLAEFERMEEIKEKLVNTMERLSLEVNDLDKIKDYRRYMKAFNKINCYKNTLEKFE